MDRFEFQALRAKAREKWERTYLGELPVILVSMASCAVLSGALATYRAIEAELRRLGIEAVLKKTGCIGADFWEPLVDIALPGRPRISYARITAEKVPDLLESVLVRGDLRPDLAVAVWDREAFDRSTQSYQGIPAALDHPFFAPQKRIVLANAGYVDPEDIDDYIARGGYTALVKALFEMTPEQVIEQVKLSGLRGRGGAGFPTGIKWESARAVKAEPKYMICNGHEGEPNVFKDRRILESDPHRVLEGLILGGYAVGTPNGYNFIGGEYPLAIARWKRAVEQAYQYGLLGENILGSGFSFHVETKVGAGGYIAGEGSALMFSLEGKRPMPRTKPPRSVEAGLWMRPTALNNVETLANVPDIVVRGGDWYASMGTEGTKGTKVFTFAGHVVRTGTFEVEVGATMRQMVYDICGGIPNGRELKAVQCAGPSGGCLPPQFIDLPVDFESLDPAGTMMGSGGMIVLDDSVCIVDYALYFARFNAEESCGKCTPCRIGTEAQYEIWKRIAAGEGRPEDLKALEDSSRAMMELSLCGLGQTAPLPTLSALRFFREELLQHIRERRCPRGVCETSVGAFAR